MGTLAPKTARMTRQAQGAISVATYSPSPKESIHPSNEGLFADSGFLGLFWDDGYVREFWADYFSPSLTAGRAPDCFSCA